jgi:hypothetical protein
MNTRRKTMTMLVLVGSLGAFAAPPGGKGRVDSNSDGIPDRAEHAAKRARLMYVVAISEALELSDADALKMAEKIKAVEDRRQPVRQAMHEAMKAVKAAADGDATALEQVDANVQKVLDGRAQMAAMDKELFQFLAKDLAPVKRAKLALALARLGPGAGMHARGMGAP